MKSNTKIHSTGIIAIFFIAGIGIISLFFHRGVYLVDALSGERINDIHVFISPWRILFEPFIGPLLFCLRGHAPLIEFLILLGWVIIGLFIFLLFFSFKNKNKSSTNKFKYVIRRWFAFLPLLVIFFIGLLCLMVFISLPANTIKSDRPDTIFVNFHSHTCYSHDGMISPENLIKWHRRNKFDAFFITEHNHHLNTLRLIAQVEKSYNKKNICIMPGQEYSGSNHLLLLGVKRNFVTKDMADKVAIDSINAHDGIAVVAHWFADRNKTIEYYIDCGVDGFEVVNQGEGIDYDRKIFKDIVAACQENNLIMLGDVDYHGYGSACYVWNALKIKGWKAMPLSEQKKAIMFILQNHANKNIQIITYSDRRFLNKELLWLSPILNSLDYFKSLNIWQLVSWISWVFILLKLRNRAVLPNLKKWFSKNPYRKFGIFSSISAVFVFVIGAQLIIKSFSFKEFNNTLQEYGLYLLVSGLMCGLYNFVVIRREKRIK